MNELVGIYKLLSDETRLRVIMLLQQEELCVCEICGVLDVSQPKVSKCLSKLRDLNLVEDTRKEKFVFYSLKKTHKVLNSNLNSILNSIDDFKIFALDQQRLIKKETYLDACSIEALNKVSEV